MLQNHKKIAAIHDLSGVGRCSLSVILPTMSVMGVQVCPVPTAVLSTHTGGLGNFVFHDLTDYVSEALRHYLELNLEFDCIYSGFLGSEAQIAHCVDFIRSYPNALAVVDPVMGDKGKPYKTYTARMCRRMSELACMADLITPNLTEAYMLLGEPYPAAPLTVSEAKKALVKLAGLGPKLVIITGAEMADGKVANLAYDREKSTFWRIDCDYVPVSYPGTGDIFASVVVGALLNQDSLPMAVERASRFLELAIKTTYGYGTDPRMGVMLENCLFWLTEEQTLTRYTNL